MTKFFFKNIFQHKIRSLSIILSIFLLFLTITGSFYIYKNVASAIEYYSGHGNNPNRVTISASANLLNIFNAESALSEQKVKEILENPLLENTQVFRLVSIPVSAKFGFFSFALESDIPVFSVTDSALQSRKNEIPVGMSRTMIDLYNTQFAGSSAMFPQMKDFFLKWQKIEFTFGKSKIFQSSSQVAEPIVGTISDIHHDFPALGLVLPESIVEKKLSEIGFAMGSPYKIVAYIKNLDDKKKIEELYQNGLTTRFEIDEIAETKRKIGLAGSIVFAIGTAIVAMFGIFFIFLLGGYFRERKNIFTIISLFGLKSIKSYILTIWEPLFLASIGLFFGFLANIIFINFFHPKIANFIDSYGILFPTFVHTFADIFIFFLLIFTFIFVIILLLEWRNRKKFEYR